MGCSYTFGEGLNDDQTLAARVSRELGYSANVVNLGIPGHGPHQVLRELETDRLPGVTRPVKHVIFETIYYHVRRTAGRARWDPNGPRYDLDGDSVIYRGPFRSRLAGGLISLSAKSALMRYFYDRVRFGPRFNDRELEVYGRIIERSARLAREKLGADFTIIYWDDSGAAAEKVLARLRKTGLPLILVSSIIPRKDWDQYLFAGDKHPNARANEVLGRYVANALNRSE
jgi:hypothetical protein